MIPFHGGAIEVEPAEFDCPSGHGPEDAMLSAPIEVKFLDFDMLGTGGGADIDDRLCVLMCALCNHRYGVMLARKRDIETPQLPPLVARCPNDHPFNLYNLELKHLRHVHDRGAPLLVFCRECRHCWGPVLVPPRRRWL